MVAELLAWCGAGLSCLLCVPQALRTLRLGGRLDGISSGTYWMVLANAVVWVTWSLLTGELAVGVPALVNGPAAVLILRRLTVRVPQGSTRADQRRARVPSAASTRPTGVRRLLNVSIIVIHLPAAGHVTEGDTMSR
jgi:hypothetical protein